MSQLEERTLTCAACTVPIVAQVATSLNAVRSPAAREAALAGRLHHVDCPHCRAPHRVETTFGYMDVERGHWLAVFPPEELPHWGAREAVSHDSFWQVSDRAPMLWNFRATEMTLRCVFGLADLREKLLIWDSGLDDAIVEAWKLELEATEPALATDVLRFAGREGDEIIFAVGQDGHAVAAPWGRYTILRAQRSPLRARHPALFKGPFVDRRRLRA